MADIEELVVRIRADATQLERELRKAQGVVKQSAGGMETALGGVASAARSLLPALSAIALVQFGRNAIEAAGHVQDLALRTGIAATTLSALEAPLANSGSSLDEFSGAINRMNNLIGEAAKGNQDAIRIFNSLGLSVKNLAALSTQDQLFAIAQALGQVNNQAKFTNTGIDIFGRTFASIAPAIKETSGNLSGLVEEQQKLGKALDKETLDRIDAFGDALKRAAIDARNEFLSLLATILKVSDAIVDAVGQPASYRAAKVGPLPREAEMAAWLRKSRKDGFVTEATVARNYGTEFGPLNRARGSNADLLNAEATKKARQELAEYNRELQRQHEYAGMAPRDAAAQKAYYDTLELATKAGVKGAEELARANAEVARSSYDMQQAMQESARFAAELKDQFAQTAGSIMFDSKNAGDALNRLSKALAEMIAKRYILGPLADSLFGSPGSGGGGLFGGLLGFADGGSPPVGVPSIVGERGPELFVPRTAGTIIPNGRFGGSSVVIQQTIHLSPGLAETVNAAIINAAPGIAAAAQAGTLQALQKGGDASRIAGLRN